MIAGRLAARPRTLCLGHVICASMVAGAGLKNLRPSGYESRPAGSSEYRKLHARPMTCGITSPTVDRVRLDPGRCNHLGCKMVADRQPARGLGYHRAESSAGPTVGP